MYAKGYLIVKGNEYLLRIRCKVQSLIQLKSRVKTTIFASKRSRNFSRQIRNSNSGEYSIKKLKMTVFSMKLHLNCLINKFNNDTLHFPPKTVTFYNPCKDTFNPQIKMTLCATSFA